MSGTHAVGDAQATGVGPAELPDFLRRAPDRAQAFGSFAQFGFVVADAHGDDIFVAPPRRSRPRSPRDGFDDELDGLQTPAAGGVVEVTHAHQPFANGTAAAGLTAAARVLRLVSRMRFETESGIFTPWVW